MPVAVCFVWNLNCARICRNLLVLGLHQGKCSYFVAAALFESVQQRVSGPESLKKEISEVEL